MIREAKESSKEQFLACFLSEVQHFVRTGERQVGAERESARVQLWVRVCDQRGRERVTARLHTLNRHSSSNAAPPLELVLLFRQNTVNAKLLRFVSVFSRVRLRVYCFVFGVSILRASGVILHRFQRLLRA